jgi:ABC-type multidrug transport system fused ATPase/permease subunit
MITKFLSNTSKKIGLTDMLKILPEFKKKILFFVLLSLLVSILDILGISFVGLFILTILKSEFSVLEIFPNILVIFGFSEIIYILCFILVLIYFLKGVLSYLIHRKIIFYCYEQQNVLRKKYLELFFYDFDTLQGQSFENKVSAVIEFIKKVTENYLQHLLKIMTDIIVVTAIFGVLFYANPISTIFLLILFFLTIYIYKFLYKKKIDKLGIDAKNYIQILIKKSTFLFEAFKEIKLFGKENQFTDDLIRVSDHNTYAVKKFAALLVLPKYYAEFIFVSFLLLISVGSILKYGNSELAYAQIGIYGAAAARIAPMMNSMLQSITSMWNNRATMNEVAEFFAVANLKKVKSKKISDFNKNFNLNELSINNVSFSYPGLKIFEEMSLKFNINSLVGVYGRSGTGKSTFVNLLTGFLKIDDGEICIKDLENSKINDNIFRYMGIIPQEIRMMDSSIAENVTLELDKKNIDVDRLEDALKKSDAYDFVSKLPDGFNTKLNHSGLNLSGGQRQRIAIARVLYRNSKILIMDEPFSSLDESSEEKLLNLLQKIKKDKIIFIVTHKKSLLNNFDVVIKKDGYKFTLTNANVRDKI